MEGTTETDAEKLEEASKFYNELYSYQDPCDESLNKVLDALRSRTLATPDVCEQPISIDEVIQAIKATKRGKSPGSDGIPYEYYKQHAEELVTFLAPMFNELIRLEILTLTMREGVITLIFKKKGSPSDIRQYRPITLLTCDLKLFTSILARRIAKVTHQICDPQNTAIPGRQISDSTMTLHVLQQMLQHA